MATPKDKPCGVCGDVGFEDLIATCSKCDIAREHIYCMRETVKVFPEFWVCEICKLRKGNTNVGLKKVGDDLVRHTVLKKQRVPEGGKIQFMSPYEAIRLSSGVRKNSFPSPWNSTPGPSMSISRKVLPESTPQIMESRPQSVPLKHTNPPGDGSIQKNRTPSQQEPQRFRALSAVYKSLEEQPIAALRTMKLNEKKPVDALVAEKGFKFSNTKIKKVTKEAPFASSLAMRVAQDGISGVKPYATDEHKNTDTVMTDRPVSPATLMKDYPCLPAKEVSWKGAFFIADSFMPRSHYGGLEAHAPSKVRRKILTFIPNIPQCLPVQFFPQDQYWEDLFQDVCPDMDDVGLYFFPNELVDRSEENISDLLECMEKGNLVIRSCVHGVELLIFTSKQLSVQSQKLFSLVGKGKFLWGIFRPVKQKSLIKADEKHPQQGPSLQCAHNDIASIPKNEVMDMDIDMIGGVSQGKIDVVVPRSFRKMGCSSMVKNSLEGSSSQIPDGRFCWSTCSTIQQTLLAYDIKPKNIVNKHGSLRGFETQYGCPLGSEYKDHPPPGFEKMSRLKLNGNSSKAIIAEGKPHSERNIMSGGEKSA